MVGALDPSVLIVAVFAVISLICIFVRIYRLRQRRRLMQDAAARLGFDFTPQLDAEIAALAESSTLAAIGYSQATGRNVLQRSGQHGSIVTFDYSVPRYKNRAWSQTVVLFILDSRRPLPSFLLRPAGSPLIGFSEEKDMNVPLYRGQRFSEMFVLTSAHSGKLHHIFSERVVSMLEEQPGICIECSGDAVMFFYLGRKVHPDHLMVLIENAERTLEEMLKAAVF